ncbi:4-aminobutyrate--2-oxoglutarate transaminase [Candidatus Micrarchaeota archaeon]|nr:4-aminobutyrate--2-oxoglutarate transaminase [Candidatus Micrarchaeota archaeon]
MTKSISLKTKIPGPKSKQLLKRKLRSVPAAFPTLTPIFIKKGRGAIVEDVDGNKFIDFSGGIGALNTGHSNSEIVKEVKKQAEDFFHTCFVVVGYEQYVKLCEKLNSIVPIRKAKTCLFNSGAEAVENAIKIARKYTGKQAIVSFDYGFHGRTLMTLSLTGKVKPYKLGFGPFAPETYKLPYPYVYRRPRDMGENEYVDYLIESVENEFFKGVADPENIAAIIMEPVAGEGGFIAPPKRYVQKLVRLCKENDILFIADEVQTGFGRTGKMFASEHFGIEPDIITMAKSLSSGLPLSAVSGRKEVMDSVHEGGLGTTFGGNPLSCASALATIDFIERNKLAKKAQKIGKIVIDRFTYMQANSKYIGNIRGLGAMCALEFVKDRKSMEPYKELTKEVTKKAYENGLILLSAGLLGNDIRTLMPLVITDEQLEEGLDVLEKVVLER